MHFLQVFAQRPWNALQCSGGSRCKGGLAGLPEKQTVEVNLFGKEEPSGHLMPLILRAFRETPGPMQIKILPGQGHLLRFLNEKSLGIRGFQKAADEPVKGQGRVKSRKTGLLQNDIQPFPAYAVGRRYFRHIGISKIQKEGEQSGPVKIQVPRRTLRRKFSPSLPD